MEIETTDPSSDNGQSNIEETQQMNSTQEEEYTRRIHMMKQKATKKKKDKERKKRRKAAKKAQETPARPEEAATTGDAQEAADPAVEEPTKTEEAATGDDAQEAVEEPAKPEEEAAAHASFMAWHAAKAREDFAKLIERCKPTAPKYGTEGNEATELLGSKLEAAWEWAQSEEEASAVIFRDHWNRLLAWAPYEEITNIPSMRYTYSGSRGAYPRQCVQIVSVKLESITGGLHWPLQVFGHVFIRDVLDHKRNMIFDRQRDDCQTITRESPYLALTGPTRGVVVSVVDPSYIEVDLKVKGTTESEDKDLSSLVVYYRATTSEISCYTSRLSTLEFRFCCIPRSVEATIMARVTCGSWPDGLRGVFTAACKDDWKVKLLDFGDGKMPVGVGGLIKLSRSVVSVGHEKGELKVCVMACPVNSEQVVSSDEATFTPQKAGISPGVKLKVGSCRLKVCVGWSIFEIR